MQVLSSSRRTFLLSSSSSTVSEMSNMWQCFPQDVVRTVYVDPGPYRGLRGMLPCMKMLLIWKLNEFIWGTLKTNIRAYIINNMNKGDLECKNVFYIFDSSCLVITSINIIELSRCSIVDGPHGSGRTLKDQNLYSQTFWESSPNLA